MANQQKTITEVEYSEYKGNPVILLPTGNQWPVSFGVKKAKTILNHIDDIKKFVEANDKWKYEEDLCQTVLAVHLC